MGLLNVSGLRNLHTVFDIWWNSNSKKDCDDFRESKQARGQHRFPVAIKACGLWDTVNSVWHTGIGFAGMQTGGPPRRVTEKTAIHGVEHVYHALSLHECRPFFQILMASVPGNGQHLEQCWFSGYHGDIGGGRPDDALAHLALAWMMGRLDDLICFNKEAFWSMEMRSSSWTALMKSTGESVTGSYSIDYWC